MLWRSDHLLLTTDTGRVCTEHRAPTWNWLSITGAHQGARDTQHTSPATLTSHVTSRRDKVCWSTHYPLFLFSADSRHHQVTHLFIMLLLLTQIKWHILVDRSRRILVLFCAADNCCLLTELTDNTNILNSGQTKLGLRQKCEESRAMLSSSALFH